MDLRLAEDHLDGPPLANDPSSFSLSLFLHLRKKYSKYFPPFLPWVSSPQQKNIFSFSKVQIFPSFSFTAKKTYFPPPLPFSSPPQKKTYFSSPNILLFFPSPYFFSSTKNTYFLLKFNIPFRSPFYLSPAKQSLSKYHLPFPSMFIFSSKDTKKHEKSLIIWQSTHNLLSIGYGVITV